MHAVRIRPAAARRGFTLIEVLVVVAIMGIMLSVGLPSMSRWLLGRKAVSAAVFYQEGYQLARDTAVAHNSHSRLVFTTNATNSKKDWRVDICFTDGVSLCDAANGSWSTVGSAAANDPVTVAANQFLSVQRLAQGMPTAADMTLTVGPNVNAKAVYFTPLGWIDTAVTPSLTQIDLAPSAARANAFTPLRVKLTLGGVAVVCQPSYAVPDVRGCPP